MLQRLGLAQALIHDPQLLILDEPTDGVDPVGRSEMRVVLQQLKTQGKTVFINSHLLQEVELVCDRVAILNHGRVLREGNIAELTRMSESQVQFTVAGPEHRIRAILNDAIFDSGRNHSATSDSPVPLRLVGDGQFQATIQADRQEIIDQKVDALRREGISIVSIEPSRQTLEEAFLNIVRSAASDAPRGK
jgi:ABC-2 type transport system ATP-binding protein